MGKSILDYKIEVEEWTNSDVTPRGKEMESELTIKVSDEDLASVALLNTNQRLAYNKIIKCINQGKSGAFFVDSPGGTGKSFLYKTLLAIVRSHGEIALATASLGVAASILPGGRTAHLRFKIPLNDEDNSGCNVKKQSDTALLIRKARLIIWDEATMAKRYTIECFDKLLEDLMDSDIIFRGKIVIVCSDFRQTLSIITKGFKEDYICASLMKSHVWNHLQKFKLTQNMHAYLDKPFSDLLLSVGNGTIPVFEENKIVFPASLTIPFVDDVLSLNNLIDYVFPDTSLFDGISLSVLNRAILTTENEFVDEINGLLIARLPEAETRYFSYDEIVDQNKQSEHEDFLHSLHPPSLPPQKFILKPNCPLMLLRNLNPAEGLCNGTRLVALSFTKNLIHAKIAVGNFIGKEVFIPKITLQRSDDQIYPVPFRRSQFPVRLCFAMTINKAQGQTLDSVGLYLKESVFSHEQLYVALSRAKTSNNVRIFIRPTSTDDRSDITRNIVYHEALSIASQS